MLRVYHHVRIRLGALARGEGESETRMYKTRRFMYLPTEIESFVTSGQLTFRVKNDSNCTNSKLRAMGRRVPCIDTSMHMEDLTNGLFSRYVWSTTIRRYYPTQQSTKKTFV